VCACECVCVCTVLNSYCYGAGFRTLSVCAGYQRATHLSCQLATMHILPTITYLHTKQTALLSETAANIKDKLHISALLLKLKLHISALLLKLKLCLHALRNRITSHCDSE
jgi:hypothetical protein